jgi:hypothetical protein
MGRVGIHPGMPHLGHGDRARRHGQIEILHGRPLGTGRAALTGADERARHQADKVRGGGDRQSRWKARNHDDDPALQTESLQCVIHRSAHQAAAGCGHMTACGVAAGADIA